MGLLSCTVRLFVPLLVLFSLITPGMLASRMRIGTALMQRLPMRKLEQVFGP